MTVQLTACASMDGPPASAPTRMQHGQVQVQAQVAHNGMLPEQLQLVHTNERSPATGLAYAWTIKVDNQGGQ